MAPLRLAPASLLLLIPLLVACATQRGAPEARPGQTVAPQAGGPMQRLRQTEAKARLERQRREDERCLRERPGWAEEMAALRRAEARLARVKAETYVPSPAPEAWDEASESRFRREDRDADWQRHLDQREEWERQEQSRRDRWRVDWEVRLAEAQSELNRQARALRQRRADLFTGPSSIEFNPDVADQVLRCRKRETNPMGRTAPPNAHPIASRTVTMRLHSETSP